MRARHALHLAERPVERLARGGAPSLPSRAERRQLDLREGRLGLNRAVVAGDAAKGGAGGVGHSRT